MIEQLTQIDFWQHLYLATVLTLILRKFFFFQKAVLYCLAVALLWEVAEYFYNMEAYQNLKHYLLDSFMDLSATILAIVVLIFIGMIKGKNKK